MDAVSTGADIAPQPLAALAEEQFADLVWSEAEGIAGPSVTDKLRSPAQIGRWKAALDELEIDVLDEVRDQRAGSDQHRDSVNRLALVRARRRWVEDEIKRLNRARNDAEQRAAAQRRSREGAPSRNRSKPARQKAMDAANGRLREAHQEEFREYLAEELALVGLRADEFDAGKSQRELLVRLADRVQAHRASGRKKLETIVQQLWAGGLRDLEEISRITGLEQREVSALVASFG
jgi:hypothetical protein